VGFDASDALTIKGTPSALAFVAGNGEVTAADDAGLLAGSASAFDFLRVAGVELQGTWGAVSLEELHADDRGTSGTNEFADLVGFVHGERSGCRLSPVPP